MRLRDQLGGMAHLRVALGLVRADLPLGEGMRERAQLLLLLRQGEGNARRRALVDRRHHALRVVIEPSVKRYSEPAKPSRSVRCGCGDDGEEDRDRPARLPRARRPSLRRGARDPRHRAPVRLGADHAVRRRVVRARRAARRAHPRAREARPVRDAPRGLRPARGELGHVWARLPGARGGRRRHPQPRLGAGLALDVRDLALGLGGAEAALAAADARRREDRLLRADRAGRGLRSRLDAHDGEARRLRLDPQRREDVDHERLDRGRRDRLGAHRGRRDQRLPRREGHARFRGSAHASQALAARLRHLGARAARRARARGEPLPRDRDPARAALLPQRGALRDRVRRGRLGACLSRDGTRLREGADRLRQADRRLPAHAAEARGDGARGQPRRASSRSTSDA